MSITIEESEPTRLPVLTAAVDAEVDAELRRVVPERFAVTDESSASWLVRKIVAARDYATNVKAWAEREQRRAAREEQTLLFIFGKQIELWTKDQIEQLGGRRKSLFLPSGSVGFRASRPRLVIDDDSLVAPWAKQHCPQAIIVTERLSKAALFDHVSGTGEMPDVGVHWEESRETFFIRSPSEP